MPAGQLRPPPAHQPLPAHFNTATHIAMRPGNLHKFINQVICIQCIDIFIKLQAFKSFEDLIYTINCFPTMHLDKTSRMDTLYIRNTNNTMYGSYCKNFVLILYLKYMNTDCKCLHV